MRSSCETPLSEQLDTLKACTSVLPSSTVTALPSIVDADAFQQELGELRQGGAECERGHVGGERRARKRVGERR